MNFISSFIKNRFIDPATKPLLDKISEKDEIIKVQQGKVDNIPHQFATPFGGDMFQSQKAKYKAIVDFGTLRSLSEQYDVARACINKRKRQVNKVEWNIVARDEKDKEKYKVQIEEVTKFFRSPGGRHTLFREFVDKMVEDILVLDAGCIWKDKTVGGKLIKLVNVDGATIRLKINEDGSTPEPPKMAFEQFIGGEVVAKFTADDMIYMMMNSRSNTAYGLAPLESLILGVDAALRSQLYNLNMLTEGNIPEGFFSLPEKWTPQQIKDYQVWWDALISGNPSQQQRIKFTPGGKGVGYKPTKKPSEMRFLEYEEWLLKKCCALFDVPPQEIGFTMDVNKSTGKEQTEIGLRTGLEPMLNLLTEMFGIIIAEDLGLPQLRFNWRGLDNKDEVRDAEKTKMLLPLGLIGGDEWRAQNDLHPIGLEPYVMTPQGPVFVKDLITESERKAKETKEGKKPEEPEKKEKGVVVELKQWRNKALKDIKLGKAFRQFESKYIQEGTRKLIEAQLLFTKSRNEVREIFDPMIANARQDSILDKAVKLKDEISSALRKDEATA